MTISEYNDRQRQSAVERDLRCPRCQAPLSHFTGPNDRQDWHCTNTTETEDSPGLFTVTSCGASGPVRRLPEVKPFNEAAGYESEGSRP